MQNYYIDQNIYIYSLSDTSIGHTIEELKRNNIKFLYSPAHIEEVYKALVEKGEEYHSTALKIIEQISSFTDNSECHPSKDGIVICHEHPCTCYKRVARFDTTDRIKTDGQVKYEVDKNHYAEMLQSDKHNQSITTVPYNQIWNQPIFKEAIIYLNKYMPEIIKRHNSSPDNFMCMLLGANKSLPENLQIEKQSYKQLALKHNQLEYIMELLFRVLNHYGYYADKTEGKTISGIHDVTHAIYATKAQKLFTTDNRFAQKCRAVYYYLGVPTQVILCAPSKISDCLKKI